MPTCVGSVAIAKLKDRQMKVTKSQNNKLIYKIQTIYRWTEDLDEIRCKQLNLTNYEVDTVSSIREQLVDKKYTASISQAMFITEVYNNLRPSFGIRLQVTAEEIFGGPE